MITSSILFIVVLFSNWCMDSIKFRYSESIFFRWRWLRETKFFGYKEFWKSDHTTRNRKYKDEDPQKGRKQFLGITLPQALYDGWHFWKSCMVIAICLMAAHDVSSFLMFGALWLIVWWLLYDFNYKTN